MLPCAPMRALVLLALAVLALPARADDASRLESVVTILRESTAVAPDGSALFPGDLAIESITAGADRLVVRLSGTPDDLSEEAEELRLESFVGALSASGIELGIEAFWRNPDGSPRRLGGGGEASVPTTPGVKAARPRFLTVPGVGALAGRRIAVSAGHGWLASSGGGWHTQRARWAFTGCGSCRGITEDFFSAELVSRHLVPLLQAAGAEVVLVREPDHAAGRKDHVVDDGGEGYSESAPFESGTDPSGFGGGYRTGAPGSGAAATYRFPVDGPGLRHLSLRGVGGANRTQAALVEVVHGGGSTAILLDQRRFGGFWLDLGAFWFPAGEAVVRLSGAGDGYLVADALRLGGGVFRESGKPFWQMAARSYVPWAGAGGEVTASGDISIRPAYAEYVGADLYVSIHANASGGAGGGTANGTSTYRYSCQRYGDHSSSDLATACDDPPGSRRLTDAVQGSMLRRLRAEWDPAWNDRGRRVANFGELRSLDDTPGVLVETAFFDNLADRQGHPPPKFPDNRSLHDPRWRESLALGVVEGLVEYLGGAPGRLPARPDGLVLRNAPDGSLHLAWRAAPDADRYRIQWIASPDPGRERAWTDGLAVEGTTYRFAEPTPGATYAFRVTALNGTGAGYPSQAVVARARGARNVAGPLAEALVIAGYDRRDAWVQEPDNDLGSAIEHAQALSGITGADVHFDGALDEAVEDGTVPLAGYRVVDYAAGKDSVEHEAVSAPMQALLRAHVAAGGALILSGEEVGYALVERSQRPGDQAFVTEVLGAEYLADDADSLDLRGVAGTAFADLSLRLDDGTGGTYAVSYPDLLAPVAGAAAVLDYPVTGAAAAVLHGRVFFAGVPLEAVVPAASRISLFSLVISAIAPGLPTGDRDLDGAPDGCETAHGFDPLDGADGSLDRDGDGVSNAAECAAGTNPLEPPFRIVPDPEDPGSAGDAPPCGCRSADAVLLAWLGAAPGLRRRRR